MFVGGRKAPRAEGEDNPHQREERDESQAQQRPKPRPVSCRGQLGRFCDLSFGLVFITQYWLFSGRLFSKAVLGVGRIGETHLRNLAAISGIRVIAVADLVKERAERGRVMTGAELAMTDSLKAIEHPSVDAVVIVTTTDTHAQLIEQVVSAGKAVWSEKPIALNL